METVACGYAKRTWTGFSPLGLIAGGRSGEHNGDALKEELVAQESAKEWDQREFIREAEKCLSKATRKRGRAAPTIMMQER